MNLNYVNQNLKKIVIDRFKKSKKETGTFDKFIALWISFNAFYSGYTLSTDPSILNQYKETLSDVNGRMDVRKDGRQVERKVKEELFDDAIKEAITAQMRAVKAVTQKD